ncbi:hypothetical protein E5288_WYG002650 [Bos mutus]|uniref:Uncharacterized protein n=1 Tax=Bos mutus TaxID=72004 RepID=A0A6B0R7E0_9CETA|nr:hypothetical protein [Bos mutus]
MLMAKGKDVCGKDAYDEKTRSLIKRGHSPEKECTLPGKRSDRDSRQRLIVSNLTFLWTPETCRDKQYKAKNDCDSQERSTDQCFPVKQKDIGPEFITFCLVQNGIPYGC